MKASIISILTAVAVCVMVLGLQPAGTIARGNEYYGYSELEKEPPQVGCPVTLITDNDKCMKCHVLVQGGNGVEFGLKEIDPYAKYEFPPSTKVVEGKLHHYLVYVNSSDIEQLFHFVIRHPEFGKHIVIEVDSFGGGIFEAWRIKAFFTELESRGYIVETRTRGVAMSAGFIIFVSGTKGYRFVDQNSEFMLHELWSIEWPKVATPSDKEQEAKIYRHLQDNINDWVSTRGSLTKDDIDKRIKYEEMWVVGAEMVELKFADGFLGDTSKPVVHVFKPDRKLYQTAPRHPDN